MKSGSKTAAKQRKPPTGKPFTKGDPRINRKGRPPANSAELNALIDEIFMEPVKDDKGNSMEKLRVALNRLLLNKSPAVPIHILERRYGRIPQPVDVKSDGTLTLRIVHDDIARAEYPSATHRSLLISRYFSYVADPARIAQSHRLSDALASRWWY